MTLERFVMDFQPGLFEGTRCKRCQLKARSARWVSGLQSLRPPADVPAFVDPCDDPFAFLKQHDVIVCHPDGQQCKLTTEEWFYTFHHCAMMSHDALKVEPQMMCRRCLKPFTIYIADGERFEYKGKLAGTVRILAEAAARTSSPPC